jgi:Tfp pilus assembly protein PilN
MRAVNLLPRDDASTGRKRTPLPVLVGCIGCVLVTAVLAVSFLSASGKAGDERRALEDAQAQYNAIPAPPPPSPVDAKLPAEHQTRVTALATALGQRLSWVRLLREGSQVVPSDVWLVTLNATSPTVTPAVAPTPGAKPQQFIVTGCTYSQDSVARFLARLSVVPDLSDVTLGRATASSGGSTSTSSGLCPNGMVTFTLNGNLRTGGAAS